MPTLPIAAPAGYYPPFALAYGDPSGEGVIVDAAHPLPVAPPAPAAAASSPLAGSTSATGVLGPFAPDLARPIRLSLSGTWAGTVTVKRSHDGGTTKLPLTGGGAAWGGFTANACEPVAEESEAGATYYLDVALASGTLTYRMAQ